MTEFFILKKNKIKNIRTTHFLLYYESEISICFIKMKNDHLALPKF